MVAEQIEARGIRNPGVLNAMRRVPRHEFVPAHEQARAYADGPLAIGHGQTISQPYIVALMTELAGVTSDSRVLEVGTGCGYQTAVLLEITPHVYSIEIVAWLGQQARNTLTRLGYGGELRIGDGHQGWLEEAPFHAIIVTAAPRDIPRALLEQLSIGGRLVIPVGDEDQELVVVKRTQAGFDQKRTIGVRFVPMTGNAEKMG